MEADMANSAPAELRAAGGVGGWERGEATVVRSGTEPSMARVGKVKVAAGAVVEKGVEGTAGCGGSVSCCFC